MNGWNNRYTTWASSGTYARTSSGTNARTPRSETGIYLSKHQHSWRESGTHKWPSGNVWPVWVCRRCGDVLYSEARGSS